jgi:HPt (histidine-containing phosphotransfer) domain-containing protein
MPNYKSITAYSQTKSRIKAVQEAEAKLPEAEAKVKRLRTLHSQLCKEFGDSGNVRQQLEDAENHLAQLKQALK